MFIFFFERRQYFGFLFVESSRQQQPSKSVSLLHHNFFFELLEIGELQNLTSLSVWSHACHSSLAKEKKIERWEDIIYIQISIWNVQKMWVDSNFDTEFQQLPLYFRETTHMNTKHTWTWFYFLRKVIQFFGPRHGMDVVWINIYHFWKYLDLNESTWIFQNIQKIWIYNNKLRSQTYALEATDELMRNEKFQNHLLHFKRSWYKPVQIFIKCFGKSFFENELFIIILWIPTIEEHLNFDRCWKSTTSWSLIRLLVGYSINWFNISLMNWCT